VARAAPPIVFFALLLIIVQGYSIPQSTQGRAVPAALVPVTRLLGRGFPVFATPAERNGLSVVAGDTPGCARITGPKNLTDLGKGQYGKWVGCRYSIQWGDGSGSPAGPIGADCARGLSHIYKNAGTYRIVAKTFHPAPNDSHIDDWIGEAGFVVK
jgi:hypothetical protein